MICKPSQCPNRGKPGGDTHYHQYTAQHNGPTPDSAFMRLGSENTCGKGLEMCRATLCPPQHVLPGQKSWSRSGSECGPGSVDTTFWANRGLTWRW
jgi:hypothetical protein